MYSATTKGYTYWREVAITQLRLLLTFVQSRLYMLGEADMQRNSGQWVSGWTLCSISGNAQHLITKTYTSPNRVKLWYAFKELRKKRKWDWKNSETSYYIKR